MSDSSVWYLFQIGLRQLEARLVVLSINFPNFIVDKSFKENVVTKKNKKTAQTLVLKSTRCPEEYLLSAPVTARPAVIPTLCFQTFTELGLGLSVGPQAAFWVELVGHGGCGDHRLQAALALGHVLLRMKEHHVHFGHVEHSQRDGRAQADGDGQGCGLDVHLFGEGDQETENNLLRLHVFEFRFRKWCCIEVTLLIYNAMQNNKLKKK